MDKAKCKSLKAELVTQPEPQIVSIARFFDGNDDIGSIGCNLIEHPGMDTFRDVLTGLLCHQNVKAVYAQIAELDPVESFWPYADTVLVVGAISVDELRSAVRTLEPDEVSKADDFVVSPTIIERHDTNVLTVWWD